MPKGHYPHRATAPCAGCGVVRADAVERSRLNGRRFARAVYLASRRGLAA